MRRFSRKQYLVAGAAAVIVAAGTGAAYAYWTSSGSGSGTATTGTSSDFVVTVDSTTLGDLTPGGPTESVAFHVNNPGSGGENLSAAVASVTSTSNAGCTAADFSVGPTSIALGDIASHATVDGTFSLQMIDTGVNQDACQGVTVNLQVDAS